MPNVRLNIAGLSAFRNDLRAMDRALPRELQQANKEFAEGVAPKVQAAYRRVYPKPGSRRRRRSKNTAQQIRATATQTAARVTIGGARYPYMLGQEFGSDRVRQFAPRVPRGRFLYPTLRREMPGLEGEYLDVIDRLAARAFPERGL